MKKRRHNTAKGGSSPASCCAFFACKVAFSLPETEDPLPDEIISKLMDIAPGNTVVETTGGPCSPPLLLVDAEELPTPEWVESITARMNAILHNDQALPQGGAKKGNDEH